MGEPKGYIVVPLAENPDDELRSLEVDAKDNLKVSVEIIPTTVVIPHADEHLFGVESAIIKTKSRNATGTSNYVNSDAVPTDKIWVITHITAYNADGDIATQTELWFNHDGDSIYLHVKVGSVARWETVDFHTKLVLDAGDYIQAWFEGVEAPETCHLNIFGYQMNAP